MAASPPRSPAARFSGLDGLRAIAVALVLCYHLFPGVLPGGFLGVDVFFVISGFLITSLLLREIDARGRIRFVSFWRRRARRLLPPLALVLLVSVTLALFVGGDLLVGIGAQFAGASLFVSNWVFIADGADYFTRDTPELFRNTWSLSIEEQFYIVLPVLLALLTRMHSRASRAIPLLLLGAGSAALMIGMSLDGADATRIYFGSDTHVFGLLLGAAMAVLLGPRRGSTEDPAPPRLPKQLLLGALALGGIACLAWLSAALPEASPQSFQGGFQLATLAALVVVGAVTRRGAWIGRALDAAPLRWIGERSYGIYLWHWPLLLILRQAFPEAPVALVGASALLATVLASALSYRFVEQPVRRFGLRRSVRMLLSLGSGTPRRRSVAIALGGLLAVTVPATCVAFVRAPAQSSAASAIARGQHELELMSTAPQAGEPGSGVDSDEASQKPGTTGKPDPKTAPTSKPGSEEKPAVIAPTGMDITAVGDSVMLASLPELTERFPDIAVDAAVSRSMGAGVEILSEQRDRSALRRVVVAGLGTNGPVDRAELDELRGICGDRPLVLVNAHGERDWIPGVNGELSAFADAHRGVVVADWDGAVVDSPDALAGDGIHPEPSGGRIYADSVQRAIDRLQQPDEALGFSVPRR